MHILKHLVVASFCLISYASAHADEARCSKAIIETVLKYFSVPDGGEIRDSTCMRISGKFDKTLAAVAHAPPGYSFANSEGPLPYYVAVIFESQIETAYVGGIIEDGAIQISRNTMRWDNQIYNLSKNIRAFSLLIDGFRLSGAMDGEQGPDLTLVAYNGDNLHPVVKGLSTFETRCLDLPCKMPGAKRLEKKIKLTLSVRQTNGLRDLIFTGTRFDGKFVWYRSKYDGLSYSLDGWSGKWYE